MADEMIFPSLAGFEPTRQTLQLYSRAMSAVPRAHLSHGQWWHISLKAMPEGLVTERVDMPAGGQLWLTMDLTRHAVYLMSDRGQVDEFSLAAGLSAAAFGDQLLEAVKHAGLPGPYEREKFASDEARVYDKEAAGRYLSALTLANRLFNRQREDLMGEPGETGPVQLWPHNFDLSMEWFGTRRVAHEEGGETQQLPAQLNLGFYPGDPEGEPYFYSNPWPFEGETLLGRELPAGARWHTEGWQGTILPYAELAGDPAGATRLMAYAQAVYDVCAPTLMEGD
jgi:hypothetical protein